MQNGNPIYVQNLLELTIYVHIWESLKGHYWKGIIKVFSYLGSNHLEILRRCLKPPRYLCSTRCMENTKVDKEVNINTWKNLGSSWNMCLFTLEKYASSTHLYLVPSRELTYPTLGKGKLIVPKRELTYWGMCFQFNHLVPQIFYNFMQAIKALVCWTLTFWGAKWPQTLNKSPPLHLYMYIVKKQKKT